MNERDSEAVAALLRNKGYSIVQDEGIADVILLNTCSVREQAEQKAIGKAGYIAARKRKNPKLVLGIMGCMAQNQGRRPDRQLARFRFNYRNAKISPRSRSFGQCHRQFKRSRAQTEHLSRY